MGDALLTEVIKGANTVADTDDGERAYECPTVDNPEALVLCLLRQNESVSQWRGGTTHGHEREPRRM